MKLVYQRVIITGISLALIVGLTILGVKFLQGYRVDINKKQLKLTGLLVVKTHPLAAQLFINGKLSGATDVSLSLPEGEYDLRLTEPGYQSWTKKVKIKNGLVTQVEATLWPLSPDLSKITYAGVLKPILSPNRNEIAYILPNSKAINDWQLQPGLYILSLSPKGILSRKKSRLIAKNSPGVDFSKVQRLIWSPDGTKIMAIFSNRVYLLSTNNIQDNLPLLDISYQKESLLHLWSKQKRIQERALFEKIKAPLSEILAAKTKLIDIAPDDNLIFYQATASGQLKEVITPPLPDYGHLPEQRLLKKGSYYVYDIKEDKNYLVFTKDHFKDKVNFLWMADSQHLLVVQPGKVSIVEYDGGNFTTVFTGKVDLDYVFPAPSGKDVIVWTSLNPTQTDFYNLYNLSLR